MAKKLQKIFGLFFLGLLFWAEPVQAQSGDLASMAPRMKDGVIMYNNSLLQIKDGEVMGLTDVFTTPSGTRVSPDGTVIKKSGQRQKLKNGYAVNMEGNVVLWKDDMFKPNVIQSYAQETIGNTETEIIVPAGSTATVLDKRTYERMAEQERQMQMKLRLMEQKNALLEQQITEMEVSLGTSRPDTRNIDTQLSRIDRRLDALNRYTTD